MAGRSGRSSSNNTLLFLVLGGALFAAVASGRAQLFLSRAQEQAGRHWLGLTLVLVPLLLLAIGLLILHRMWQLSLPVRATRVLREDLRSEGMNAKLATHHPRVVSWKREPRCQTVRWFWRGDMTAASLNSAKNRATMLRQLGVSDCRFRDDIRLRWGPFRVGLVEGRFGMLEIPGRLDFSRAYARPLKGRLPWVVGDSAFGRVVEDLTELPHLISGGETGSGKTFQLIQQGIYFAETHTPDELQLALVDLKQGAALDTLEALPHSQRFGMATTLEEAEALLGALVDEMTRRLRDLRRAGIQVKTIDDWNALHDPKERWPYIVLMVDEAQGIPQNSEAAKLMARVFAQGRAPGIHAEAASQRPDSETISKHVLANSPAVLAYHVANDWTSTTMLGAGNYSARREIPSAEEGGAGLAIWRRGEPVLVRTPYLSATEAAARVEAVRQQYRSWSAERVWTLPEGTSTGTAEVPQRSPRSTSNGGPPSSRREGGGRTNGKPILDKPAERMTEVEVWVALAMLPARDQEPPRLSDGRVDYYRYIHESAKWKLIRRLIRIRSGGMCERCTTAAAQECHHETYDHLGYEDEHLEDLQDLCRPCHETVTAEQMATAVEEKR